MVFAVVCLERTWNDLDGTPEDAPAEERRARRAKRVSLADMTAMKWRVAAGAMVVGDGEDCYQNPRLFRRRLGGQRQKQKVIEAGIEPATFR